MSASLGRRCAAEAVGTALLVAIIVGSGIMGDGLFPGSPGMALLANALATGAGLVALILTLGDISGAHFNPAITAFDAFAGGRPWREVPRYAAAQIAGGLLGVIIANVMFDLAPLQVSHHARDGLPLFISEVVATFGLVLVIAGATRRKPGAAAYAVGAYISAAYWFTPSTSFANPAVTIARSFTDTFAGVRPVDAVAFIAAQLVGAALAAALMRWLHPFSPMPVLRTGG